MSGETQKRRDEKGRILTECKCSLHDNSKGDYSLLKVSHRKIPASLIAFAHAEGLFPLRANSICTNCVAVVDELAGGGVEVREALEPKREERMEIEEDHSYGADRQVTALVDQVCAHLRNGKVCAHDRQKLALALGESEADAIAADMPRDYYNDAEALVRHNVTEWMEYRNSTVKAFLNGITRLHFTQASMKKRYSVAKAVESIYYAKDLTYIGPIAFTENLVQYSVSGSKFAAMVAGSSSASPSYTTLLKWLNLQSAEGPVVPAKDCVIAFDNNQRLQRTFAVSMTSSLKCSTITNVMSLTVPGPPSQLQYRHDLMPQNWRTSLSVATFKRRLKELDEKYSESMTRFHDSFLQQRLDGIRVEVAAGDDVIDRLAEEEQKASTSGKRCETCHSTYNNRIRKCPVCGDRLVATRSTAERVADVDVNSIEQFTADYGSVPSCHPSDKPEATIHEPCMVNPNSVVNIDVVMEHIKRLCLTDGRQWIEVVCDGSPYTVLARLILEQPDKYNWMMLKPGLGHVEINSFKSIFNLSWEVFMGAVAQLLNFRSEKARDYAKSASDHHKAWEMLLIALHGTVDELMVPYVRICAVDGSSPTVGGFKRYIRTSEDDTLKLVYDILSKMVAIMALRTAIRRNNSPLLLAARRAIHPLWFGLNHPKYRLLEFFSFREFLSYPPELRDYSAKTDAFCMNDEGKGEAPDFILESKNKGTKKWVVGTPTEDMWRRVCTNYNLFEKIRLNLMEQLGIKDPADRSGDSSDRDVRKEILGWRIKLRASEYLTPTRSRGLVGFDGARLNPDLLRLNDIAAKNFDTYVNSMVFRNCSPTLKCIDLELEESDSEEED